MGSHTSRHTARDTLDALRRIVQALRESSRRAEQRLGITGAQLFVVEQLADTPCQSLNELAARTFTHQSSVSTVVARLVEEGLVSRHYADTDARRLELMLTARGRRLAAQTTGAAQGRLIGAVQRLPPRSRRQLGALLRRVVLAMDAADEMPRMFFDDGRNKRSVGRHA
jgi:MarR family transcriptional regulator, lower aerobic nicotinate degradation pathway regulator